MLNHWHLARYFLYLLSDQIDKLPSLPAQRVASCPEHGAGLQSGRRHQYQKGPRQPSSAFNLRACPNSISLHHPPKASVPYKLGTKEAIYMTGSDEDRHSHQELSLHFRDLTVELSTLEGLTRPCSMTSSANAPRLRTRRDAAGFRRTQDPSQTPQKKGRVTPIDTASFIGRSRPPNPAAGQ
jgi:hypothetical protein